MVLSDLTELLDEMINNRGITNTLDSLAAAVRLCIERSEKVPVRDWESPESRENFLRTWRFIAKSIEDTVNTYENRKPIYATTGLKLQVNPTLISTYAGQVGYVLDWTSNGEEYKLKFLDGKDLWFSVNVLELVPG